MYKLNSILISVACLFFSVSPSNAGVTVYESEDKAQSFEVGAALKGGLDINVGSGDAAPEFVLNNARFYTQTQLLENVGFAMNVEKKEGEDFNLLDGFAFVKVNDLVQLRAGRTKAPFDRATLASTFNRLTWNEGIISKYPEVYNKRNQGGAIWGTYDVPVAPINAGPLGTLVPRLKYQAGVFDGITGAADIGDLLYAGRVTLNLLDPENAYTAPGSYFGTKNILTVGTSIAFQENSLGITKDDDYLAWNVDLLFEGAIPGAPGVFSVGASINVYDLDGAEYVPGTGLNEGTGFSVEGAWVAPYTLPVGPASAKLQPFVRYQEFNFDGFADGDEIQIDAGVNYLLTENAIITLAYARNELLDVDADELNIGIRFKF